MPEHLPSIVNVRVRFVVIAWLMIVFYLPGADYLAAVSELHFAWYSWYLIYIYYAHFLFAALIAATILLPSRTPIPALFGKKATKSQVYSGLVLSAFLFLLAWPAAYVVFLPLSYWIPDFVNYWYIDTPRLIIYDNGVYPFVANVLNIISLCVMAPVFEEFAFRGLILHRWTHKYGLRTAILGSSLVFGIVHSDPLGAFFFGIGMCLLYVRTQSLMVPIICHAIYNATVWLYELGLNVHYGPDWYYSLEDFQKDWPYSLAIFGIILVWVAVYIGRSKTDVKWALPGA